MPRIENVFANALPQWIQESSLASSCTQIAQTALASSKACLEWAAAPFGWAASRAGAIVPSTSTALLYFTGVAVLAAFLRFRIAKGTRSKKTS